MTDPRSHLAIVGTYTEDSDSDGLYRYRVDPESGALDRLGSTAGDDNPSFLALHPNGEYLYAVNQVMDGAVSAYEIDRTAGTLTFLNRVASRDARPAHISVEASGRYALVAHYTGGSVAMLPIDSDGHIGAPSDVIAHEGSSVHPDRQTAPHPHSIYPDPENRYAYVPDLGTDRIVIYEMDLEAGKLRPADPPAVSLQPGAGPRHLDFHPDRDIIYVINELDATITAFDRDPETGNLSEIETANTLPADYAGPNTTADVHVHPSGRWLYGSNRGHDSIAVFELDERTGSPRRIQIESTKGEWPRNFAIDPTGIFLYAENAHTNDIVVFRIDQTTGRLTGTDHVASVPRPVCMVIWPMA